MTNHRCTQTRSWARTSARTIPNLKRFMHSLLDCQLLSFISPRVTRIKRTCSASTAVRAVRQTDADADVKLS